MVGEGWGRGACPGSIGGLNRGIELGGVPCFVSSWCLIGSSASLNEWYKERIERNIPLSIEELRRVTSLHRAALNGAAYLILER